jgi:hypothetical protein
MATAAGSMATTAEEFDGGDGGGGARTRERHLWRWSACGAAEELVSGGADWKKISGGWKWQIRWGAARLQPEVEVETNGELHATWPPWPAGELLACSWRGAGKMGGGRPPTAAIRGGPGANENNYTSSPGGSGMRCV